VPTIFWLEKVKERDHSEKLNVDGRLTFECLEGIIPWESVDWMSVSGYGPAAGFCENGNEHSDSRKGGEFLH